jgi:hypothetical protein
VTASYDLRAQLAQLDLTARESVDRTIREMRSNAAADTPNPSGYKICCGVGGGDVVVLVEVVVVVVDYRKWKVYGIIAAGNVECRIQYCHHFLVTSPILV